MSRAEAHPPVFHARFFAATLALVFGLAVALAAFAAPAPALAAQDGASESPQLVVAQAGADTAAVTDATAAAGAAEAIAQPTYSGVSVKVRPKVQNKGWLGWVKAGKTAGTKSSRGLRGFKIKLTGLSGLSGQVHYQTYDKGKGWGTAKVGAKSSGRTSVPAQKVKIWLTGDVAAHYDVLYRVYVVGKGWQPWAKNKAATGIVKSNRYITALQVELSPKTKEAAGSSVDAVGVRYEAHMRKSGWQAWTGDGKKAGKTSSAIMDKFVVKIDEGNTSGGLQYRAYVQGKAWSQGWKKSGSAVGASKKRIEALQIKLTGTLSKLYDVYYCTYVDGYGWLDWAKNGEISGSTGKDLATSAVRVKLVKKGGAAPASLADRAALKGIARVTTINQLATGLNGIDISSWQAGINIAKVPGDFVIVKATGGVRYTNPYFKSMADATLASGKLLGLYHFAREASCPGTAKKEADYFAKAVGPYVGKAVLVLDFEADALLLNKAESWAKTFLDRVYKKTGVRPLIYMSKGYTHSTKYDWSAVAKNYKLWVAQYPNYLATGYEDNPWTDSFDYGPWSGPTIFQYTSTGVLSGYGGYLDLDLFYGKEADWAALAQPA